MDRANTPRRAVTALIATVLLLFIAAMTAAVVGGLAPAKAATGAEVAPGCRACPCASLTG